LSDQPVDPRIQELRDRKAQAYIGGGEDKIARQHARGRMTARERLQLLLDKGTFREVDVLSRTTPVSSAWPNKSFPATVS